MIRPEFRTRGRRRRAANQLRGWMGTSSEGAPSPERVMRSVVVFDELLRLSTNGRLRLAILDRGEQITPSQAFALTNTEGTEDDR